MQVVKKAQTCRVDWHQTGSMVVVSFFAKACLPESSSIEANPTNVSRSDVGAVIVGSGSVL